MPHETAKWPSGGALGDLGQHRADHMRPDACEICRVMEIMAKSEPLKRAVAVAIAEIFDGYGGEMINLLARAYCAGKRGEA